MNIPLLPALQNVIDNTDIGDTNFVKSSTGRPNTVESFSNFFRKACDKAGLYHCSGHGLRSDGATLASENGATTKQMMAIFGWSDIKHAEQYARDAHRKKLAGDSIHTINPEGIS